MEPFQQINFNACLPAFGISFGAMLLWILTAVLFIGYGSLLYYYGAHWKRLPAYTPGETTPATFLSVVIAARNEEATLPPLLSALQAQSYPAHLFEIIVVDDYSTDGTAAVVHSFTSERIRLIRPGVLPEHSSKKRAIEAGVTAARGELVVITDADCLPTKDWLQTMAACYKQKGAAFIAAPVKFSHNHSPLQLFQALDFMVLQGITAASVGAGAHSMCNGANLAYTRQAFFDVNGFEGIDKVASGDDMLLMHKIWKKHPHGVAYLKSETAIITTDPMPTWRAFVRQRRRWASKTVHYDDKRITAALALVFAVNLLFFALLIAALFQPTYWWLLLAYWLGKTGIEYPFVASVARFYGAQGLLKYFLFFQPLHIAYTVSVGLLSQLGSYEWKGRRTR